LATLSNLTEQGMLLFNMDASYVNVYVSGKRREAH
jgi:hypothetical protein